MSAEEWRIIPSEFGYEASSLGRIRNAKTRRVLRPATHRSGHLYLAPHSHTRQVHHLVMEAFVGTMPTGQEVRHLDGDPANNVVGNLAYGTRSQNMLDKGVHGTNVMSNKTHCPRGHLYDEQNTRTRPGVVSRACKTCEKVRVSERHAFVAAGGQVPDHIKHGASTYRYWRCRCDLCCAGAATARAAERARKKLREAA